MYDFIHFRVSDFMTTDPVTVSSGTTLADAQGLFEAHGFNGLPVVDDGGRLEGVVTKMDVLRAFTLEPSRMIPPYGAIMLRPVTEFMSRALITVAPDTPLTRVLHQLVELRVKSLPVVDGETLVGVIAREDLLRALRESTAAR